eukprot:553422-Amphidinium_carterae.1
MSTIFLELPMQRDWPSRKFPTVRATPFATTLTRKCKMQCKSLYYTSSQLFYHSHGQSAESCRCSHSEEISREDVRRAV